MRKIKKVIELYNNSSLSIRELERATQLARSTVNDYISRYKASNKSYAELKELSDLEIYQLLFPNFKQKTGKIRPDYYYVNNELKKKHVTRQILWEEYKERHPEGLGYTQFCYHLKEWQKKLTVSMRQIHKAGEKLFIDYSGLKGEITDRKSGKKRLVDIFVATLGASSYTFAEASENQKLSSFINSHIEAFEYFGGIPEILVPDNLKSAVTKATRYNPQINASYEDMAEHYNTIVIPARPYHPKDKSKVELAVKLVQRWILAKIRNEIFYSLEELNIRIRSLLEYYNDKKIKRLNKSRKELFLSIDKPALKALPKVRYEFKNIRLRRVNIDYHIEIEGSYYSVPYQLTGKEVLAKYNSHIVTVYYNNRNVAIHPRFMETNQVSTDKTHMPQSHKRYADIMPSLLIEKAKAIGEKTGKLVDKIINESEHPEKGYRTAYGILRVAQKYKNDSEVEYASAKMLVLGTKSNTHFESILKRKMWQIKEEEN